MINSRSVTLLYLLAGFACVAWLVDDRVPPKFLLTSQQPTPVDGIPAMRSEFISGGSTKEVHSATAVELPGGDIGVFWYAGTREGSSDTAIFSRFLRNSADDPNKASWSGIHRVVDRLDTARGLRRHVRKVGNPVAVYHRDELWLFYVTVSVGGWSGSSISLIRSTDGGRSWGRPERLVTSPFFNIATLVRERAVTASDGSILLPVYHELLGKFAEVLNIDADGNVVDKYRISHGRKALQPLILPQGENEAIAFMRNAGQERPIRILTSESNDAGRSWRPLSSLQLPNPNSAVTGVALDGPNELLLVFNNDEIERDNLTMAYSPAYQAGTASQWQIVHEFENASTENSENKKLHNPYSYPFLIKATNGDFHLFYTWKRQFIKYVFFNRVALNALIDKAADNSRPSKPTKAGN
jgi:predicted neuraminidase